RCEVSRAGKGGEDDRKVFPRKSKTKEQFDSRVSVEASRGPRAGAARRVSQQNVSPRNGPRCRSRWPPLRRPQRRRTEENPARRIAFWSAAAPAAAFFPVRSAFLLFFVSAVAYGQVIQPPYERVLVPVL